MQFIKIDDLRINTDNLLGIYADREKHDGKFVDSNCSILVKSLMFDNSVSTLKIRCNFDYAKQIVDTAFKLLENVNYMNINSIVLIRKDFIKVYYENSYKDIILEDLGGEQIFLGRQKVILDDLDAEVFKKDIFEIK